MRGINNLQTIRMAKRTIRTMLELIIILAGVTAATLHFSQGKEAVESLNAVPKVQIVSKLRPDTSDARWEQSFFKALAERTNKVKLPSLKTALLTDKDVEVRFWYDARPDTINGFVIRRSGDLWSAIGIRQVHDRWPSPVRQESLSPPKSGWGALWKSLVDAGVLTLPDGSETKCNSEVLDGGGFVVETVANQKYRTYRYGNPQLTDCDEAKRMVSIERIIADEFRLHPPQN